MTGTTRRTRTNRLAGGLVFGALGAGLLLGGAAAPSSGGYGPTEPPRCGVGGYSLPCAADVSNVGTDPNKPRAGKGFDVRFTTDTGGSYRISAKRLSNGKRTKLGTGVAGTGNIEVKNLGKSLKAGRYVLRVRIENGDQTDNARNALRVRRG